MVETGLGWGKYDLALSIPRVRPTGSTSAWFTIATCVAASTATRFVCTLPSLARGSDDLPRAADLPRLNILLDGDTRNHSGRGARACRGRYPRDLTIHSVFRTYWPAAQNRSAIGAGNSAAAQALSYDELKPRCEPCRPIRLRISRALQPDEPVGICLDRRCRACRSAMLGILKSRWRLLSPIDPDYPARAKCASWRRTSGMRVIVTDATHASA